MAERNLMYKRTSFIIGFRLFPFHLFDSVFEGQWKKFDNQWEYYYYITIFMDFISIFQKEVHRKVRKLNYYASVAYKITAFQKLRFVFLVCIWWMNNDGQMKSYWIWHQIFELFDDFSIWKTAVRFLEIE